MTVELETPPHAPALVPIECDYLDKDNLKWAKTYLTRCQAQLEALEDPADPFATFLKVELETYQELVDRFTKPAA